MKTRSGFVIFYVLLAAAEITAEQTGNINLVYLTKPLLVLSLIIFVASEKRGLLSRSSKTLFLAALFFAWCGDIFLMIRGADLFIPGLGSFLIMQWLYISIFQKQTNRALRTGYALFRFIPFLVVAAILFVLLISRIFDPILLTAIAIYMISISAMAWLALLRYSFVPRYSFLCVFSGAVLFMISDALIAINRFITPIPFEVLSIMGTYAAAQLLITLGETEKGQAG